MMPMEERSPRNGWLGTVIPLAIWMAYFTLVYAVHSIGCVLGWNQMVGLNVVSYALIGVTAATLMAIGVLGWRAYRGAHRACHGAESARGHFAARLTVLACALALLSTVWVGLPMLMVPPCH